MLLLMLDVKIRIFEYDENTNVMLIIASNKDSPDINLYILIISSPYFIFSLFLFSLFIQKKKLF